MTPAVSSTPRAFPYSTQSVGLEILEVLLSFVGPLALRAMIGVLGEALQGRRGTQLAATSGFTANRRRPVAEGIVYDGDGAFAGSTLCRRISLTGLLFASSLAKGLSAAWTLQIT